MAITFAEPLEWSKSAAYAENMVVFVTKTRSTYTSRKAVPANTIEVTNTDYWTQTGGLDSKISALQTEVTNNKSDADNKFAGSTSTTLLTKINSNTTNIANNKSDADNKFAGSTSTTLLTKINSNTTNIANNKSDADKKFAGSTSTTLLTKIESAQSDADNIKTTLYTPVATS